MAVRLPEGPFAPKTKYPLENIKYSESIWQTLIELPKRKINRFRCDPMRCLLFMRSFQLNVRKFKQNLELRSSYLIIIHSFVHSFTHPFIHSFRLEVRWNVKPVDLHHLPITPLACHYETAPQSFGILDIRKFDISKWSSGENKRLTFVWIQLLL